ncbi:outer membrane beta-barrel protein [Lacinutrix jangbogonensis]|uniref:outer membrane beta-barrel protein n=1 Tax=Lacinutrix jangbogonensis TaxID=1469557 RepID=UPI0009E0277B|nr:outer membrane beta-barrel protein [Lacinutrix jangbogonensis]
MKNFAKFYNHFINKSDLSKRVCLTVIFVLVIASSAIAQNGRGFGIKAGLNYNTNGDYYNSATNTFHNPKSAIGFHIGVFGKIGGKLYIKPELMYTKTTSEYATGDFSLQRIDAPILVGLKIIGPVSIFAGPAFQYILNSDIENATVVKIENDFSVGLNFGVAVHFNSFGIDLRYERGFTENETTVVLNNSQLNVDRIDSRPSQLILSLSVKL